MRSGNSIVTVTGRAVTVGAGDEVIAWDLGGRLYSVWRGGRTCRRGLDGRILEKWHQAGRTERMWLDPASADALVDECAARAAALLPSDDEAAAAVLARAARFDAAAGRRDARRFAALYGDVGILPPDQYLATVVQITEGCSFRSCGFCDLFDRPFRVKSIEEFREHVAGVREYLGESRALRCRSVFLGAANALALPVPHLLAALEIVGAQFGGPVGAFVDGHTGWRKTADDYRALAAAGLRRAYVGLESGHDPLLAFVRKPATVREAIDAVRAMKGGGVAVAVIVMPGLGGARFARGHVADTIAALNEMPLDSADMVYFSDLVVPPGGRYAELTCGIEPLDESARAAQRQAIRNGLRFPLGAPRMSTYDISGFVY